MDSQPPALDSSNQLTKFSACAKTSKDRKTLSHSGTKQTRSTSTRFEMLLVERSHRFDGISIKIN
jgi:hypothetical protein